MFGCYFIAEGPFNNLTGNVIIALSKSNTALTVMPISLNGSSSSHTMGYKNNAARANGQQINNSKSHSINVANSKFLFQIRRSDKSIVLSFYVFTLFITLNLQL